MTASVKSVRSGTPRLCVMISGGGRTLLNLADHIERGTLEAEIAVVIASHHCAGVDRARTRGLQAIVMPGVPESSALERTLAEAAVDWVVLGGYLRLLRIAERYRWRFVNIHPALLPSFGGPGMYGMSVHRAVIDAGCRVSGCTVHLCDERFDHGPILAQRACEVSENDTPESLAARVFDLECALYPETLARLLRGRLVIEGQRARVEEP